MFIVKNRVVFYTISAILVIASIAALFVWGLKPGIDFKGGSIVEVEYASSTRPLIGSVDPAIKALDLGDYSIRETGASGFIVRTSELTPEQHNSLVAAMSQDAALTEKRFDSVGPILGKEALQKSWISIGLVLLAIILFITFVFRRVSRPVSSFKYGLTAIIGLAHNILITAGAFAVFGHYFGFEIDTLFVTALLVILGFSIHDTIVVFDRVRENLSLMSEGKNKRGFDGIVGESIKATFVRSINTSLTTLVAIIVLYIVGPEATKHFSLALIIGIAAGTYSSIFLCSPLLVSLYRWQGGDRR
jgi:preprotein translocase subunit SecF